MGRFFFLFFVCTTACAGGNFTVAEAEDGGADSSDSSNTPDEGVVDAVIPDGVIEPDSAEIDSGRADGSLPEAMLPGCLDNSMCAMGQWCRRESCDEMIGACTDLPPYTAAFAPACGCDGITYWNAPYAHSLGVTTHDGVCKAGARKGCGSGCQYCAHEAVTALGCSSGTIPDFCVRAPSLASCAGSTSESVTNCDGTCSTICTSIKAGQDFFPKTCKS